MSEWGIALMTTGAALAGAVVTGWYTRGAGKRQAEAARHAGDRQADAALATVRATLREQRAIRVLDLRRQTYVAFLGAAESVLLAQWSGSAEPAELAELERALAAVVLEGPSDAAEAARTLASAARDAGPRARVDAARETFLTAARAALDL
ncbi:hypothetical protein [Streptomyces sp. RFCAC02]|uniref:hypothetical protein n=1 Tax=Streptomyces sp. RFCAC02 TaxID=2499143 RepID=UPI00101FE6F8|nr:hypothetical protein [Streptomyces sp. RFCAC02]